MRILSRRVAPGRVSIRGIKLIGGMVAWTLRLLRLSVSFREARPFGENPRHEVNPAGSWTQVGSR
jgi:hypothetical protein